MTNPIKTKYRKPFIGTKKIKTNFSLARSFGIGGDLLAIYCGECYGCEGCYLPPGCDVKSC